MIELCGRRDLHRGAIENNAVLVGLEDVQVGTADQRGDHRSARSGDQVDIAQRGNRPVQNALLHSHERGGIVGADLRAGDSDSGDGRSGEDGRHGAIARAVIGQAVAGVDRAQRVGVDDADDAVEAVGGSVAVGVGGHVEDRVVLREQVADVAAHADIGHVAGEVDAVDAAVELAGPTGPVGVGGDVIADDHLAAVAQDVADIALGAEQAQAVECAGDDVAAGVVDKVLQVGAGGE